MIYHCIDQLEQKAEKVASLCRLLEVSRSGYYASRRRARESARVCQVTPHLQAAFAASGRSYGSRRLRLDLHARGIPVGRYRVRRLMRANGLSPVWKRKFIHTTDSRHPLPIADNVLARQFNPAFVNESWAADITYIRTSGSWLYLAVVMDLFSRKIIGWAMAPNMPAELACSALQMAITQRNPLPGLIVHSDRGVQYASESYRTLLARHGLRASMSRKGNCWDNAVIERFFLNLKMERAWQRDYANAAEAIHDIADYIVTFYNNVRLHSTLGYLPPNAYELKSAAKSPIHVSENT